MALCKCKQLSSLLEGSSTCAFASPTSIHYCHCYYDATTASIRTLFVVVQQVVAKCSGLDVGAWKWKRRLYHSFGLLHVAFPSRAKCKFCIGDSDGCLKSKIAAQSHSFSFTERSRVFVFLLKYCCSLDKQSSLPIDNTI